MAKSFTIFKDRIWFLVDALFCACQLSGFCADCLGFLPVFALINVPRAGVAGSPLLSRLGQKKSKRIETGWLDWYIWRLSEKGEKPWVE